MDTAPKATKTLPDCIQPGSVSDSELSGQQTVFRVCRALLVAALALAAISAAAAVLVLLMQGAYREEHHRSEDGKHNDISNNSRHDHVLLFCVSWNGFNYFPAASLAATEVRLWVEASP